MYRDRTTGQYPLSKSELASRYPNTSLPAEWDDSVLDYLGVDYVKPVARPETTATQRLVEGPPEQHQDGQWYQTWTVQDMSAEEVAGLVAQAKAEKIAAATAACDAILAPLGAEYGVWERQTWDQQVVEAQSLMTDPLASVPLIAAMAAGRGMDKAELAQRILFNRETWTRISGSVIGQRQKVYDQVQAVTGTDANALAQVAAIEVAISLPG